MEEMRKFIGFIDKQNSFYNFSIVCEINSENRMIEFDAANLTGDGDNDWFLSETYANRIRTINISYRSEEATYLSEYIDQLICISFSPDDLEENIAKNDEPYTHRGNIKKKIYCGNLTISKLNELDIYCVYGKVFERKYNYKNITFNYFEPKEGQSILLCDAKNIFGLYEYKTYQGEPSWIPANDGKIIVKTLAEVEVFRSNGISLCKWNSCGKEEDILPETIIYNRLFKAIENQRKISVTDLNKVKEAVRDIKDPRLDVNRIDRVYKAINDCSLIVKAKDDIIEAIQDWIIQDNTEIIALILNMVKKDNKELWNKLCDIEEVIKEKENLLEEKDKLSTEMNKLQTHIDELKEQISQYENQLRNVKDSQNMKVADAKNQLENLNAEIKEKREEKTNLITEKIKLEGQRDQVEKDKNRYEEMVNDKKRELESLKEKENELKKVLDEKPGEIAKTIREKIDESLNENNFPSIIAGNYAVRAVSEWSANEKCKDKKSQYKNVINSLPSTRFSSERFYISDANEFVDELYSRVQSCGYMCEKRDIVNILICLKTGFLTILDGKPGTGKTSLCNIIARCLGLDNFEQDICKRYIPVSVEKGWTSKRDFIGFYNSLTNETVCNNQSLLDAFYILNEEAKLKEPYMRLPFIIMLDEANLSLMEHYWGDFMNVADFDSNDRKITFPDGEVCKIPVSLRFMATINNDHTTEALSPRLIERSWIIKKIPVNNKINEGLKPNKSFDFMDWSVICPTEVSAEILTKEQKTFMDEFGIVLSNRNKQLIYKYMKYAHLFDNCVEEDGDGKLLAQDFVFAQKILPLLSGYGEDFGNKLKKVVSSDGYLRDYSISGTIIQNMLSSNKSKLHSYSFFE